MATGYTAISLTDGATTLNLNDGTTYVLQGGGWSPKIAGRLASTIGNRCPYEDVVEQITISVLGSSPSNAIANLNAIINLLEQARRYNDLDNVAAVTLNVEPQGVSSGAWKALVLDADVVLPSDWADLAPTNAIEDVQLRIVRRGIWTRSEYTSSTSSATANQRLSAAMPITDPGKQGYVSEFLCTPSGTENGEFHPGYLILSNASNKIIPIVPSATFFTGGGVTFPADTDKPAGAAAQVAVVSGSNTLTIDLTGYTTMNTAARRVAVIGTFKTASVGSSVKMSLAGYSGAETNYFTVPSQNDEDVQFCGVFNWSSTINAMVITPAASLYVDMIIMVDVSDTSTSMVKLASQANTFQDFRVSNSATSVSPVAEALLSSNYYRIGSHGDMWVPFSGTNAYAMRVARGVSALWQPCNSTPTALTNTFRVKALESSLIPR